MRIDKRMLFLTGAMASTGLAAVLTMTGSASAWPPYLTEWQSQYPGSTSDDNVISGLGQGCALCHFSPAGGTGWNPYGWEIRQRYLAGGVTIPEAIALAPLWDSDQNPMSWSNIVEITANTQPGWTPGNNNIEYTDMSTVTGQPPPAGILGSLDPASSPMVPLCDPGTGTVLACPCGNPQSGLNRGCDNSSGTTGAALTAAGVASLASDTVVFTTKGERPTALSLLLQGPVLITNGTMYGQGVRCVGGSLRRLFSQSAVAGTVVIPNFGGGDPTVSARSAAKGDPISPGQSRWYLVYYRDTTVLGGCPAGNTFNATQSGRIDWAN